MWAQILRHYQHKHKERPALTRRLFHAIKHTGALSETAAFSDLCPGLIAYKRHEAARLFPFKSSAHSRYIFSHPESSCKNVLKQLKRRTK